MTTKLEQSARQALEALIVAEEFVNRHSEDWYISGQQDLKHIREAITALREALDHSGEANEMVEFFSKEMKNKISVARAEQAEQEPLCNQHPDAPHGFDRNASHNTGRYVCECESWEPEQAEQEPVAVISESAIGLVKLHSNGVSLPFGTPLYAAPVRKKDLTDDEISKLRHKIDWTAEWSYVNFARAVIAKDREKNK